MCVGFRRQREPVVINRLFEGNKQPAEKNTVWLTWLLLYIQVIRITEQYRYCFEVLIVDNVLIQNQMSNRHPSSFHHTVLWSFSLVHRCPPFSSQYRSWRRRGRKTPGSLSITATSPMPPYPPSPWVCPTQREVSGCRAEVHGVGTLGRVGGHLIEVAKRLLDWEFFLADLNEYL